MDNTDPKIDTHRIHHDVMGWYIVKPGEEEPESGYSLGFDGRMHYATMAEAEVARLKMIQESQREAELSQAPLKPYSVLLLYPDYLAETYGEETYYAFVTAPSRDEAVTAARIEARDAEGNESCEDGEDFAVLLVTEGHNYGV